MENNYGANTKITENNYYNNNSFQTPINNFNQEYNVPVKRHKYY